MNSLAYRNMLDEALEILSEDMSQFAEEPEYVEMRIDLYIMKVEWGLQLSL